MTKRALHAATIVAGGLVTAGLFVWLAKDSLAAAWKRATGSEDDDG